MRELETVGDEAFGRHILARQEQVFARIAESMVITHAGILKT